MKAALKVVGVLVACLVIALMVPSITGLDPNQRRPGLWRRGDVAATLPATGRSRSMMGDRGELGVVALAQRA